MTKSELAAKMQEAGAGCPARRSSSTSATMGAMMLDGASKVSEDDGAADTTIKVGWDDWQAMAGASSTE